MRKARRTRHGGDSVVALRFDRSAGAMGRRNKNRGKWAQLKEQICGWIKATRGPFGFCQGFAFPNCCRQRPPTKKPGSGRPRFLSGRATIGARAPGVGGGGFKRKNPGAVSGEIIGPGKNLV